VSDANKTAVGFLENSQSGGRPPSRKGIGATPARCI